MRESSMLVAVGVLHLGTAAIAFLGSSGGGGDFLKTHSGGLFSESCGDDGIPMSAEQGTPSEGMGKGKPSRRARMAMAAEALDMQWHMNYSEEANECRLCHGQGAFECRFCRGTGWLMLDGLMVKAEDGCAASCPVCKTKGEQPCNECHGTGYVATWLTPKLSHNS